MKTKKATVDEIKVGDLALVDFYVNQTKVFSFWCEVIEK